MTLDQIHVEYLEAMTTPRNPSNKTLHEIWEPWARKYSYCGVGDRSVADKEAKDLLDENQSKYCHNSLRLKTIACYSYAILNETALDAIVDLSPIIEIGSGTGYWTHLLRNKGADVCAIDNQSFTYERYHITDTIVKDGVRYLEETEGSRDKTLLLCWPTDADRILRAFKGNHLIIVGEPEGGCTWTLAECLHHNDEWECVDLIDIPTWASFKDELRVYERIGNESYSKCA